MNRLLTALTLLAAVCLTAKADDIKLPLPNQDQIDLQDMEMYAFIHYSLNTYTDQEWGFGDEGPMIFNPDSLDVNQWVTTCKNAGMKGIIFTAKHHCGFCMWPSEYTDYSVNSSLWRDGKGDVVVELAEACKREGLKLGVYLSPWDRNHPKYGEPEYVEYFRNQLRELLTNFGDIYEVWFDGANGGDGWYGGANERRKIDRLTYYQWDGTYKMIRELQPHCVIWNDGADRRGDLRWVGTEAGNIGQTNWSQMRSDKDPDYNDLHFGMEDGDVWCPGETNTSIRPGWFYHDYEDQHVKSLSQLMDTYYKSVGRNSTLLLNFPVKPNGLISEVDSLRGAVFYDMVKSIFSNNLAEGVSPKIENDTVFTLKLNGPTTFNRFMASEDISQGQRVREFKLEAHVDDQWVSLKDELADEGDGLTTIGRKRIICFPTITADAVRMTITSSKATPQISDMSLYLAPEITRDIPGSGEKYCLKYNVTTANSTEDQPKPSITIDLGKEEMVSGLRYIPMSYIWVSNTITHYSIWAMIDREWVKQSEGEFSNIINNPIWQTATFAPVKTDRIRIVAERTNGGEGVNYEDIEVLTQ